MIGFLYRGYNEANGPFYNGKEETISDSVDAQEARNWRKHNKDFMQEVEITLPPKKKIKVSIPIKEEGTPDTGFAGRILDEVVIDPKTRIICNKILQQYEYCSGGFFVKRKGGYHNKMNTKNMEILQLMKDVILGLVRYEPIKLEYEVGRASKKEKIEFDRDIAEDLLDKTYYVGEKKYKTSIYGCYTRKLRKSMIKKIFEFYGGHEFQYRQRYFDLNYGAINYVCASRNSGKTFYGLYNTAMPMFKSITYKAELADRANLKCHFFTTGQGVIESYSTKLKDFFEYLLIDTYKLTYEAANSIIEWKESKYTMYLHTAAESRPFEFISENTKKRGERSARTTMDECNYLGRYEEVSDFATKSGAGTVNQISTISQDSKQNLFYKNRVKAMVKTREARPIEEIIHHVWTKYGFDKMKSRDDYVKMVEDGVFEKARDEYYKMRNVFAMKVTLDDVERMTEQQKENEIEKSVNSPTGEDGMLAEFYCELSPETPAIHYRQTIMDSEKIPKYFDKIFAGYDEADTGDEATLVIGGIRDRKLYVLEANILPKQIGKRYSKMTERMNYWAGRSGLPPSLILDVGRGPIYFRETSQNVPYVDQGIKARTGGQEKIEASHGVSFYSVGNKILVDDIMNTELIRAGNIYISSELTRDIEIQTRDGVQVVDGLIGQLETFIFDGKSFKGKNKRPDDLVSGMLYMSYYAYIEGIKGGAILQGSKSFNKIDSMDEKFQSAQKRLDSLTHKPKTSIWSMW